MIQNSPRRGLTVSATLRRTLQVAFRIGIGRVCSDEMADPSQSPTTADPEPGCNDEPEDGSQELTVVDLPYPRD